MKNAVVALAIILSFGFYLSGCSTPFGYASRDKQALRTLAGGAAGALATWNAGGAILGAFVVDIVFLTAIKYEDRQLEKGEEAARRYNKERYKAEQKRDGDKKAEQVRSGEKKAEREAVKDKKAEQVTEGDKKAERVRTEDRRVELYIENSSVNSHTVRNGAMVEADVQYTLLGPPDTETVRITETRMIWSANKRMELARREVLKTPGTYLSAIRFAVPDELPKGYCILFTTISAGKYSKTTRSVMNII